MNKESIYDNEINPLMAQIIAICQAHGIAMIANFACPNDEEGDTTQVLTMLPDENGEHPDNHKQALQVIRPPRRSALHLTTTHADGSKTLTTIL